MSSLTSVVCRLPWNEIQGQSERTDGTDGGAAFGRVTMLSMVSLALASDFIPMQLIAADYLCQTTNGDPRPADLAEFRIVQFAITLALA